MMKQINHIEKWSITNNTTNAKYSPISPYYIYIYVSQEDIIYLNSALAYYPNNIIQY